MLDIFVNCLINDICTPSMYRSWYIVLFNDSELILLFARICSLCVCMYVVRGQRNRKANFSFIWKFQPIFAAFFFSRPIIWILLSGIFSNVFTILPYIRFWSFLTFAKFDSKRFSDAFDCAPLWPKTMTCWPFYPVSPCAAYHFCCSWPFEGAHMRKW